MKYVGRLPPGELEERDSYFTKALKAIEVMAKSNECPVILLCHSMGANVGHYLLNFAERVKGREWIDENIDTYMPVGGPMLGELNLFV